MTRDAERQLFIECCYSCLGVNAWLLTKSMGVSDRQSLAGVELRWLPGTVCRYCEQPIDRTEMTVAFTTGNRVWFRPTVGAYPCFEHRHQGQTESEKHRLLVDRTGWNCKII